MSEMRKKGIEVQIGSYSLHMHNAYNNNPNIEIKGNYQIVNGVLNML